MAPERALARVAPNVVADQRAAEAVAPIGRVDSCSPPIGAATSTCTTSATANGSLRRSRPGRAAAQDLRSATHLATFVLGAGISTFELSRYMGGQPDDDRPPLRPSRRDGASTRSASSTSSAPDNVHRGRSWTLRGRRFASSLPAETTETAAKQAKTASPSDGLEPSTPSLPCFGLPRPFGRYSATTLCAALRPHFSTNFSTPRCIPSRISSIRDLGSWRR
jgi:hypothetical protein